MPVTKTAKRALRGSTKKQTVNNKMRVMVEVAQRKAKKSPTKANISAVFSMADRAVKKKIIHKNKAGRIKSAFAKLLSK